MRFLILLSLMFSTSAFAETYKFRLFESTINEFTPYVLSIDFSGKFEAGSKPTQVRLTLEKNQKELVLFKWDESTVNKVFKFKWVSQNQLQINHRDNAENFKAVVKKEISNGWGDTSINPKDEYSVWIDEPGIVLTPEGSLTDVQFEIANQTVEESCLWGVLKK